MVSLLGRSFYNPIRLQYLFSCAESLEDKVRVADAIRSVLKESIKEDLGYRLYYVLLKQSDSDGQLSESDLNFVKGFIKVKKQSNEVQKRLAEQKELLKKIIGK